MSSGGGVAAAWRELLASLEDADSMFLDSSQFDLDEVEVAEGYRHLVATLSYAVDWFMEMDPDRPRFVPLGNGPKQLLLQHPDCFYSYCAVRGGARYRITGTRGDEAYLAFASYRRPETADEVHPEITALRLAAGVTRPDTNTSEYSGPFDLPTPLGGPGVQEGHLNHRHIKTDAAGNFEIIASPEPEGENWLALGPDAYNILVRSYMFDRSDRPSTLRIEPLDATPEPPDRYSQKDAAARLRMIGYFVDHHCKQMSPDRALDRRQPDRANTIVNFYGCNPDYAEENSEIEARKIGGLIDTVYARALYRLDPDEALLIEGVIPPCDWWGLQICSPYTTSVEAAQNRATVNSSQINAGTNGEFRVAIVQHDPGDLPVDWVATGGNRQGSCMIRWQCATKAPSIPTATLVKISDLRSLAR